MARVSRRMIGIPIMGLERNVRGTLQRAGGSSVTDAMQIIQNIAEITIIQIYQDQSTIMGNTTKAVCWLSASLNVVIGYDLKILNNFQWR